MNLVRRVRASRAAVATLSVAVAAGVLALLALFGSRFGSRREGHAADGPAAAPAAQDTRLELPTAGGLATRADGDESLDGRGRALAPEAELGANLADVADAVSAPPAGELEISVHIADGPASGWVALQHVATNDVTVPFDRSATIEAPLEHGVARFHDLARGLLLVGVHVGSDPPHRALWVNSRVRGARLEFELGSASIHGRVRAPDGGAVEGARIIVSGSIGTVVTSSAADGSYHAGGLFPAGRYTVAVERSSSTRSFPSRSVDLAPGAVRDVSFGPGSDLSRWRGRVRASNGEFVRAGDGRDPRAVQLAARSGRGPAIAVHVEDGTIDQWFERDVYALRLGSTANEKEVSTALLDPQDAPLLDPRAIDLSSDLVRDVELGGFVLCGRVAPPGDGQASISLRAPRTPSELRAAVDANGTFRFVGLEAGEYELRWETDGVRSITIDAHGPIEVDLDLTKSSEARSVDGRTPGLR